MPRGNLTVAAKRRKFCTGSHRKCGKLFCLLKKIAPDLVHIWGTEYAAARTIQQVAQAAGIPVLVGIQGVMVDCALHLNDGVPARLLHSCAAQHLIDRHVPGGLLDVNQARLTPLPRAKPPCWPRPPCDRAHQL